MKTLPKILLIIAFAGMAVVAASSCRGNILSLTVSAGDCQQVVFFGTEIFVADCGVSSPEQSPSEPPRDNFDPFHSVDGLNGGSGSGSITIAGAVPVIQPDALRCRSGCLPEGWHSLMDSIWFPVPPIDGLLKIPIRAAFA
jgi:hypothetical protein